MVESMLPLILVLLGFYIWQNALRARELARALSHELCVRAGVQLLDQTVSLRRLRLQRIPGEGLRLRRCYVFEISTEGHDRRRGSLDLLDGEMVAYDLPVPTAVAAPGGNSADSAPASNVIELRPSRTVH
ncbi:MAG TPA: DUF3301 domain-containing protein [Rudaea sp.]